MNLDERKRLIERNMEETVTEEELDEILEKERPVAYIGYAPTGMMHLGHFSTVRKIADFVEAGFEFKFLIADIHAELDIEKSPVKLVKARTEYYKKAINGMLAAGGIDPDEVEFYLGSDYQHGPEYQKGYMKIMENVTVNRAKRSINEVVRHEDGMKASALLYSAMQVMDCVALNVDVAFAGTDQRRVYMLGREALPEIGERKPTCVFAPLLSGLQGGKMSASKRSSKISIHDSKEEISEKINGAYCPEGEKKDNGVLELLKFLIFPIYDQNGKEFTIERLEKYGGDVRYSSYSELESDFLNNDLHPQDLKKSTSEAIYKVLNPIRKRFEGEEDLLKRAYPEEYED